jgi:hypothetical protein
MSYLFIKNQFRREKFVLFSKKLNLKNPKNPFLVGFLGGFFGFFWVGFLLPTLREGEGGSCANDNITKEGTIGT